MVNAGFHEGYVIGQTRSGKPVHAGGVGANAHLKTPDEHRDAAMAADDAVAKGGPGMDAHREAVAEHRSARAGMLSKKAASSERDDDHQEAKHAHSDAAVAHARLGNLAEAARHRGKADEHDAALKP